MAQGLAFTPFIQSPNKGRARSVCQDLCGNTDSWEPEQVIPLLEELVIWERWAILALLGVVIPQGQKMIFTFF